MYRNSSDKRVHQTASLLYAAIRTLLETKDFEHISIKEVSATAGIGRATFYRNFDYVADILRYQLDKVFDELHEYHPPENFQTPAAMAPFFEFWVTQSSLLTTLMTANRWDIFEERFRRATTLNLPMILQQHSLDPTSMQYLENCINSLITATLYTWLENGQKESAQELMQLFTLPFQLYFERLGGHQNLEARLSERSQS